MKQDGFRIAAAYTETMSEMLEKRMEYLEKEFSEIRAQVPDSRQRKKDWRGTIGLLEDNQMPREAERLGREYRQQQTHQKRLLVLDTDHVSIRGHSSPAAATLPERIDASGQNVATTIITAEERPRGWLRL